MRVEGAPITSAWASALHRARRKPEDAILVNEYTLMPEHCGSNRPGSYFGSARRRGLGWGAGAALGAKLAEPDRLVIAVLGDGSHHVRQPGRGRTTPARDAQIAGAVHRHEQCDVGRGAPRDVGHVPEGEAARSNKPPLIDLDELPAFEQVCAAAGGYGERVETGRINCRPLWSARCTPCCRKTPGADQPHRRPPRRGAVKIL